MGKVRVRGFAVSTDGFGAGPDQSLEHPLGKGGGALHNWFYPDPDLSIHGRKGRRGLTIASPAPRWKASAPSSRPQLFGPAGTIGAGPTEGWWGDDPPYHAPTFILTHHARGPIEMAGGTTFHFVTDGIESALAQAKAAAGGLDVKIGGGVSTVRQYLLAGAIDEMHLAMSPVFLGGGESLFVGIDLPGLGYQVTDGGPNGAGDPPRADALTRLIARGCVQPVREARQDTNFLPLQR